jgi:hypothetical protein
VCGGYHSRCYMFLFMSVGVLLAVLYGVLTKKPINPHHKALLAAICWPRALQAVTGAGAAIWSPDSCPDSSPVWSPIRLVPGFFADLVRMPAP